MQTYIVTVSNQYAPSEVEYVSTESEEIALEKSFDYTEEYSRRIMEVHGEMEPHLQVASVGKVTTTITMDDKVRGEKPLIRVYQTDPVQFV